MLKLIVISSLLFVAGMFFVPRIPQDENYHNFADKRMMLGIPNTFDVMSNVLFFVAGIYGIYVLMWHSSRDEYVTPWWIMFISSSMIAVGSAYYHWHPTTRTLFWDRLPMTISFMSIVDIIIGERINSNIAKILYLPLLLTGIGSVVWWAITEYFNMGDLRLYALVQFTPVILTPLLLILYRSKYTHDSYMMITVFCYLLAKVCEIYDWEIFFQTNNIISGHTLKHLIAGLGLFSLPYMLQHRKFIN